jgi:hypothetical protein
LRFRVYDDFITFNLRNHVQVFERIFVRNRFTMLSGFDLSGRALNGQIQLVCNLKVLRKVLFDMFKSPAV